MAGNLKYSDMLKRIMSGKEVQALENNINAVRETKGGHCSSLRGWRNLYKAVDKIRLEIKDVDEEATDEDIVQAIQAGTSTWTWVKILNRRRAGRGIQAFIVSVPTPVANGLLSTKLRVGYVNCRVRCITEVRKCNRCQGYGHARDSCTATDCSNLCLKCGREGHKYRDCIADTNCY